MPSTQLTGSADFAELLEAVKAAIAEASVAPALFDAAAARKYCGLSRSGFFRALSAGAFPKPVHIEGSGDRWRKVDLDRWIERLKPARKKRA